MGTDFTGGSLLEVEYVNERLSIEQVQDQLASLELEGLNIQPSGDKEYIMRFKEVTEDEHQQIISLLNGNQPVAEEVTETADEDEEVNIEINSDNEEVAIADIEVESADIQVNQVIQKRFESIGPSIGQELKTKAFYSIFIAVIAIILFIAWAFRKVSYPVQSWKYGVTSVIALIHDIIITLGVFIFLGRFLGSGKT